MSNDSLSYKDAGVDIDAGNRFVDLIKPMVKSTMRPEVKTDLGGFGGLFGLNTAKYEKPVLVSGTDGVGTKLKLAFMADKHDTVGIDLVAMCVNDIVVQGAEPLFFLDYMAMGKLTPEKMALVVQGIADGCRQAGCALIGGETAEMPGMYSDGEYDLAGFTVGVVDEPKIIDGSTVKPGDRLIGLASSGLHSNGYSLARKVCFDKLGLAIDAKVDGLPRTLAEELLEPTRIYVKPLLQAIEKYSLKALAHITGGGLTENVPRSLPKGCAARFEMNSWPKLPIFEFLREGGNIAAKEMYRTFNYGIGMVIAVSAAEADGVFELLKQAGETPYHIGEVVPHTGGEQVELV